MIIKKILIVIAMTGCSLMSLAQTKDTTHMNALWGEKAARPDGGAPERGRLLRDGNFAMFIHWGLYSNLANEWKGKTYYGIGEWIMNGNMAGIPVDEYKATARTFNPVNFDAKAIARLAKDAGMKYIVITSKHHDGFAMYHSAVNAFNIADATPFGRDPMKELARACREEGIGFGFYYSHNQDWTAPGGNGGPTVDAAGNKKTFADYFAEKCLPQVQEITTGYGPIEIVWFDTPGDMPKEYARQLVDLVHRNQPHASVSGRVGYGMGDYATLGDMEVPVENVEGLWEAVDVTNDSWGFAGYDENWKSPKEILTRLISTVARGGTYMLNVGPKPDGTVPEQAARSLRSAGEWIRRYPQVVYGTGASPWKHRLPWGDATTKGNTVFLSVYTWPADGKVFLPGLKTGITAAHLLAGNDRHPVPVRSTGSWMELSLPARSPEKFIAVIELTLQGTPEAAATPGIDPSCTTTLPAAFASVEACRKHSREWMEKFGEWKQIVQINAWSAGAKARWDVDVMTPGTYLVELTYSGTGRMVWSVATDEGRSIRNQQGSSPVYATFPIGWMRFDTPGAHTLTVSLLEGDAGAANLTALKLTPVEF